MKEKFLPIGTVCRLKDATKYLMIIGFCVAKEEEQNKVYDYIGCMYPQGMISQDVNFLFDHSQIEEILYEGFVSDIEKEFKQQLALMLKEKYGQSLKNDGVSLEFEKEQVNNSVIMSNSQESSRETPMVNVFNTLNLNQQNDVNNN